MIELISASETLNFLGKSAPRPWIKRMLLWMIFNGEVEAYFKRGKVVAKARALTIVLNEAKVGFSSDQFADICRKHFANEMVDRLIAAGESGYVVDDASEWNEGEEPRLVSPGHFVYASRIDWDRGELEANVYWDDQEVRFHFRDDDDLFNSEFPHAEYLVRMCGMCFSAANIEMLQPHLDLGPSIDFRTQGLPRLGRPRTWDWDGATAHLIAIAQTPDGLPTGQGAQAQIENLIAEWFETSAGNSPAVSQVRQHATKIMAALRRPKSR